MTTLLIPYFEVPPLVVGGRPVLQPFGVLVAIGIFVGSWWAHREGNRRGIPEEEIAASVAFAVVPGFLFAHWIEMIFYHWERLQREGWISMLRIWDGLSSFGGFFGALVGMAAYFAWKKKPWLKHADVIYQALTFGWIFGRLGCTIAHDHPGQRSDFFLAFDYPGGARHNLGFYEFLLTAFVLAPLVFVINKKPRPIGTSVVWLSLAYSPVRFFLDFLRTTDMPQADTRYAGLTIAQYSCLALTVFALVLWGRIAKNKAI